MGLRHFQLLKDELIELINFYVACNMCYLTNDYPPMKCASDYISAFYNFDCFATFSTKDEVKICLKTLGNSSANSVLLKLFAYLPHRRRGCQVILVVQNSWNDCISEVLILNLTSLLAFWRWAVSFLHVDELSIS